MVVKRVNTKVDLFPWISMYFKLHVVDRDSSVRIDGSIHSETEDIFSRLERGLDLEFSKERSVFL